MVSDAVFRHTTAACCPCGVHSPVSAGRLHMQPFPDREVWRVLGSQQPPVGAPEQALLTSVRALHEWVVKHLGPFSQALWDDALPTPSSPARRSRSRLQPPSPSNAEGAEGIAWMCSSLERAGQQLHEMQLILKQLGPMVRQPMHEELESMHDQGLNNLLGVHATLKEAACALLQKAWLRRALGVTSMLNVVVWSTEAQGFAQHLDAVFEGDVDRFHRIFAETIDEAVETLSTSPPSTDMARGGGPPKAAEDEWVHRVLTVAREAHEGLRHIALLSQIEDGLAQEHERRLQSAFLITDACARYDPQPPTDDMDAVVCRSSLASSWRMAGLWQTTTSRRSPPCTWCCACAVVCRSL